MSSQRADLGPLAYFIAGNVGGMAGVVAGQPFDTIKVKMQCRPSSGGKGGGVAAAQAATQRAVQAFAVSANYGVRGVGGAVQAPQIALRRVRPVSPIGMARDVMRREGVRGLYAGISSPLLAVGLQKSIAFGVFGTVAEWLRGDKAEASLTDVCLAGAAGGLTNTVILTPVDQLKIAMQTQSRKRGLVGTVRALARRNLARGLYGGVGAVVLREIPGYAIYFLAYNALKRQFDVGDDVLGKLVVGGLTGTLCWASYYPLDLIKSRVQFSNIGAVLKNGRRLTVGDVVRRVMTRHGVGGFYRGLAPAVVRAFPTHAAVLVTYDVVVGLLRGEQGV